MSSALACVIIVFLSTLSLRRATLTNYHFSGVTEISIHALLAESDPVSISDSALVRLISIHALLAESDCTRLASIFSDGAFLSTLSLRRATVPRVKF